MKDEEFIKKINEVEDPTYLFQLLEHYFEEALNSGWPDFFHDHNGGWIEITDKTVELFNKATGLKIERDSDIEIFMKNIALAAQTYGARTGNES